jgi:hypothetical protein
MSQLTQDFDRKMQLAKDCATDNDLAEAKDAGLWLSRYMKPQKPLSVG